MCLALRCGQDDTAKGKRKRNEGGLLDVEWHRVVLDEAHNIRTRTTKMFKAAAALKATHRWAITGVQPFLLRWRRTCFGVPHGSSALSLSAVEP